MEPAPVSTPRTPCSDAEANDGLSEMLGPKAPGIDLAIGQDRLILTPQARAKEQPIPRLDAYFSSSALPRSPTLLLCPRSPPRRPTSGGIGDGTPLKTPNRLARHIVLLGKDELAANPFTPQSATLSLAAEPSTNVESLYPPTVIQLKMNKANGPGVDNW